MASMNKPKTTRRVVSKKRQDEGSSIQTGEMSDHRVQLSPDKNKARGIGTSFAYAVGAVMQQAPNLKGSQSNFLGEPSEVISIQEMTRLVEGK